MDNKIQYFFDLLKLSPSFSPEEKRYIFESYTTSEDKLQNGIEIFEEELEKIVQVYVKHETKKLEIWAEYLINISHPGMNEEMAKIQKIQNTLARNKRLEEYEKENEDTDSILLSLQ